MSTENETRPGKNVLKLNADRAQKPLPALDKIESYWNEVRAKRLVPSRCEIDPRGLEGVLGNAFILERIACGLARFRIAGSHLAHLTGLELRQMPVSALFQPASRDILSEALTSVFDDPAIVRMRLMSASGFGRDKLSGEMILLPLRSDLGDIDRVLGGILLEGRVGRTPRRLEILSQARQSLTGYAGPQHAPTSKTNIPVPASAPQPKSALTAPIRAQRSGKHPSERPYLQLVPTSTS